MCKARPLPLSRALPKLFPHLSVHADAYPMLGLSFSLLRCEGSENQASTDRTPCKMKTPPAKNFFPCMSGMSLCPAFRHRLRSLWHQFFRTIALMEFVLRKPCQQLSLPANEAMHVPWPRVWKLWQVLGAQFLGTICLALPSRSLQRRSPQAISKLFLRFLLRPRSCLPAFLPCSFCLAPLAAKEAKREPKHRRCFWEKKCPQFELFQITNDFQSAKAYIHYQ